MDLFNYTISIWNEAGIKLQSAASEELILEFEKKINFKFPKDFKSFYLKVNGFVDFEWNKNMISLWSLERIYEDYKLEQNLDYIAFCDYLINSHSMGYMKSKNGIFMNTTNEKVCETFEEFIGLLNTNSDKLY
ncbi:SMI1/KNR4 family protein [Flavobacterium panacagri]|uniref:SMI1/KNR4 family protein n=1 Tax=Flavobacterium panacagri TaxID=3034146 RepID=UPI0025A51A19|nr:SMI1/KNR4 family protein [Flavobacterium panacagri]